MDKYIIVAMISFVLSLLFCRVLIPILRKLKAGQNILCYVKEHKGKSGTPTMGGIAFLSAAILSIALFSWRKERTTLLCLAIGLAYMIVGMLDDFLKKKHKENLGLRAWQKFLFQTLIAVFSGIYCLRSGRSVLHLPFFNRYVDIGWWVLPLSVFVFLATVNAVNLTDGLDGLAAGTCVPFYFCLGVLILLQKGANIEADGVTALCFSLVGALLGYLPFNVSPASVFMGDTGSLALGGFMACIATFTGNALYIVTIGACFVFSVISVIIQVIYYKATGGKRVFLMSPVHHHFQKKGYSESRIAYAYFTVTLVLGTVCILTIL